MLVTPMPGVDRENLRNALRDVHTKVQNVRSGGGSAADRVRGYLDWANEAVRRLRGQISAADVDRLVLTKRYELLLSGTASLGGPGGEPILNGLLSTELDERAAAFDQACTALDREIQRWSRFAQLVVFDTSVYITHPEKLEELDFGSLLDVRGDDIHILVPIVVVDELDGLKQSKDTFLRWRASYTLGVLDRVLRSPTEVGRLRPEEGSEVKAGGIEPQEVTMELVFDPQGHVRLPINDDEIVDRTLAVQPLAGRPVKLITYDTGQAMRGRAAGLRVIKRSRPLGDEPKKTEAAPDPHRPGTSSPGRRRRPL